MSLLEEAQFRNTNTVKPVFYVLPMGPQNVVLYMTDVLVLEVQIYRSIFLLQLISHCSGFKTHVSLYVICHGVIRLSLLVDII